jgi:hypothetical protein
MVRIITGGENRPSAPDLPPVIFVGRSAGDCGAWATYANDDDREAARWLAADVAGRRLWRFETHLGTEVTFTAPVPATLVPKDRS